MDELPIANKIANLLFSKDEANHELANVLIGSQTQGYSADEFRSFVTEVLTVLYNKVEFFEFFAGLEHRVKEKFIEKIKLYGIVYFPFIHFTQFWGIHPAASIMVYFNLRIDARLIDWDYPNLFDIIKLLESKQYDVSFAGAMGDIGQQYPIENSVWNPSIIINDAVDCFIKWF